MLHIKSSAISIMALFLSFSSQSLAATTGSVTITGTVPFACSIVVQAEAGANISNLTTGATDLHVATVTENCNDPDGYTVTMSGTNSGNHTGLFIDSVSSDELAFTTKYNNVSVSSGTITDSNASSNGDVLKNVEISYAADTTLTASVSNTYSETLNFEIAAK